MEEEKLFECIAIYDVRGIQDYIFRTNTLKEIVGASLIVKDLVIQEFKSAIEKSNEVGANEVFFNWESCEDLKFENTNIKIEVLYYGGGNLVVLFRNQILCENISVQMSKNIIKNAYGLSLAYAYVEKTNNYEEDWRKLKERLSQIKATTPLNKPAGILPIVQYDRITGFPLSKVTIEDKRSKKITFEASQKIQKYNLDSEISIKVKDKNIKYAKEFDQMRTHKEEGLISIVHIDGNSMGINIRNVMAEAKDYNTATKIMREISRNIHNVFEKEAINKVIQKIPEICKNHNVEHLIKNKDGKEIIPFRPIISAGDDITFVCNERISLDIVREYINAIREGYMYKERYPFSACAGIAIVHSHYPFYKAYEIAEQCCQNAKKRAKSQEVKINHRIGNFVDFQYCYSSNICELSRIRKETYTNIEGCSLLKRPYGIFNDKDKSREENKNIIIKYSIENFDKDLNEMKNISRNTAKDLRDYYYKSKANINTLFKRLKSKNIVLNKNAFDEKNVAEYYDALEFLDIYAITKKEGE